MKKQKNAAAVVLFIPLFFLFVLRQFYGYNVHAGGRGGPMSKETKAKLSELRKGKKRSVETIAAMRFLPLLLLLASSSSSSLLLLSRSTTPIFPSLPFSFP